MSLLPDPAFARAALKLLDEPGLAAARPPRVLPSGRGRQNHLFAASTPAGAVVLKVRVDADDDATAEAERTARLADVAAPRLLAHTHPQELAERAWAARNKKALAALDRRAGGILVLEHVSGAPPSRITDDNAAAIAAAIARVHGSRVRLPPARLPEHPRQAWSDAEAMLGLVEAGVPAVLVRDLQKALAALRPSSKRDLPRPERRPVHGDLRRENVLVDGASARLIDLEHAGLGDPAADLAAFAARAPLDDNEEYLLLEAYLGRGPSGSFLERYFALKPALDVAGAAADLLRASDVHTGRLRIAGDATAFTDDAVARAAATATRLLPKRTAARAKPTTTSRAPALKKRLVTVDGTACSGKSVSARALAHAIGVPYFNTGGLYRAACLLALEHGCVDDEAALLRALNKARVTLTDDGEVLLSGRRAERALYLGAVEEHVAHVAELPALRAWVTEAVRDAVDRGPAVVEGRDAGTVLFPRAPRKLWLDADLKLRVERLAMRASPEHDKKRLARWLKARERRDTERSLAPAIPADGAVRIDTSRLDVAATIAAVMEAAR